MESLSLGAAHDIADGLEAALREELGPEVEVETHIEPLQMRGLAGRDAPDERVAAVRDALSDIAANIDVRRTDSRRARARDRQRARSSISTAASTRC